MTYDAGSAFIQLVPSLRGFQAAVDAEMAKIGKQAGDLWAEAFQRSAQSRLGSLDVGPGAAGSAKQGQSQGGAFADAFKARVQAALRDLPSPSINLRTDADRKIAQIRLELRDLANQRVGVDIDAATASAKITDLQARLKALSTGASDVRVRVNAGAAAAELAALQAEVDRLDGRNVDIDVNDRGSIGSAAGGVSGLLAGILTLGPALIPIGAAAVAGIGAISLAAGAGIGAIGVLALGLSGISDGVKNLGKLQLAASHDAAAASARQAASAQAVEAAQRGVAAAESGLANARQNASAAAVRASEAVAKARQSLAETEKAAARDIADAQRSLKDTQVQAAQQITAATRRLADAQEQASTRIQAALATQARAERSLADAQTRAKQAQDDLVTARTDAATQLEDLDARVVDGALSQRQAVLDVADAQQGLNDTLKDPKATDAQRAQAQLTYDQAVQHLTELQTQNGRLAEQQAAAAKAGVDGSAQVVSAQLAIAAANQAVKDAQTEATATAASVTKAQIDGALAVGQAQRDLAQTQQTAARSVIDAQRGLADAQEQAAVRIGKAQQSVGDAVRAQAEQQRQAAFSVAQAQAGVVSALAAVEAASRSAGTTGRTEVERIQEKLDKLSPAGLRFATFLHDVLGPAFRGLKATAQDNLLPGLQSGLEALLPLAPLVEGVVGELARAMGTLFREAGQALGAPFWMSFFRFMADTAQPIVLGIGHVIGNLAQGFAGLLMAFLPVSQQIGGGVLSLSERFAAFGANTNGSGGFRGFMDYLQAALPRVADFFVSVGTTAGHLIEALAPIGTVVLGAIKGLADVINLIPVDVLGALLAGIISIVAAGYAFAKVMALVNLVIDANPFVLLGLAIVGLVAGLVYAYKNSETFRDIVNGVFEAVKRVAVDALGFIVQGLQFVLNYYAKMLDLLGHVPGFGWAKDAAEAVRNLGLKVDDLTLSHGKASTASLQLKANQDALRTAQDNLKTATGGLNDELQKSISKFTILRQGSLDQATATSGLMAATDALRESLKTNGATLDVNTASGRANQQAVIDVARALNDKVTADFKTNESTLGVGRAMDTAAAQIKANKDRLVEIMTQSGLSEAAAKRLVDQILLTPAQVRTQFNSPGLLQAHAQVDTLREKIEGLKDRTISINVVEGHTVADAAGKFSGLDHYATGGVVPGWSPGVDNHLIAVSGGEAILRPEATRYLGTEWIHSLNRAARQGSLPAFANGGIVGRKVNVGVGLSPLIDFTGSLDRLVQAAINRAVIGAGSSAVAASGVLGPAGPGDYPALIAYLQSTALPFRVNATTGGTHATGSYHYQGRAVDFGPAGLSSGSAAGQAVMQQIFDAFLPIAGQLKELFFTNAAQGFNIKNGQRIAPFPEHRDHVHTAFDNGGYLSPGASTVFNGLGQPEMILTPSQWSSMATLAARGTAQTASLAPEDRLLLERLADRPVQLQVRERVLAETVRDYSADRSLHGEPGWSPRGGT